MKFNSRHLAGAIANSPFFHSAARLYRENEANFLLPLSKFQKLFVGVHLILKDYSQGKFPPTFADQQCAYDAEIAYRASMPGIEESAVAEAEMKKPFGFGMDTRKYLCGFNQLLTVLNSLDIQPPAPLLELGCGSGWLAEFLALTGYEVLGTTISPTDVEEAKKRAKAIEVRGLKRRLEFAVACMESVQVKRPCRAVYVFEALHHAYDWKQALQAAWNCLEDKGWLLICKEPNLIHTCASYRVAKLTNTHEIGLSQKRMIRQLRKTGFGRIKSFNGFWHFYIRPHWIAAQKTSD